jgi:uncharacterized protein YndB with AHSA1/START domain
MASANPNLTSPTRHASAPASASPATSFVAASDELIIRRVFDAPPELVFKAWSEPEHVAQWFGPCELRMTVRELDVRPGGVLRMEGLCEAGEQVRIQGEYREVEEPDWLVYADACFVGDALICETLATVTFHELNTDGEATQTRLTIHCEPLLGFDAFAQRRWLDGWSASLERLGAHLNLPQPHQINPTCRTEAL